MQQSVRGGGNAHFPQQCGINSCVNWDEHSPSTKKVWVEVSDHLICGLNSFDHSFLETSKGFFFPRILNIPPSSIINTHSFWDVGRSI